MGTNWSTNWGTGSSIWTWGRTSSLWGWRSTGTGCPGRLWSLLLWRYSRPTWTRSCAACCRWPCFGRGGGPDDPQRSLPTPTILWFCEGLRSHEAEHERARRTQGRPPRGPRRPASIDQLAEGPPCRFLQQVPAATKHRSSGSRSPQPRAQGFQLRCADHCGFRTSQTRTLFIFFPRSKRSILFCLNSAMKAGCKQHLCCSVLLWVDALTWFSPHLWEKRVT